MKYRVLLLLIASSFYSCSKSDNPEVQSRIEGTFLSINVIQLQPVRMFTMNGEVKDNGIIAQYIVLKRLYNTFNMAPGPREEEIDASIRINGDKSVESKTGTTIFNGTIADYEGNILKVTGKISENPTAQPAGDSCSDRVKNINLWRFDHQVDCTDLPIATGYVRQCKILPGFFMVMESPERLYIPIQNVQLSNYTRYNDQHSECYYIGKGGWNLINPDTYKNLRAGDTLIVQEKRLILEKK